MLMLTTGAAAQDLAVKAANTVAQVNDQIMQMVADADEDITNGADADKVIAKLVEKTTAKAEKTIDKLSALGFEIECDDIEVTVGGFTVIIDPLIIIGWEPI
jgi:hypothetical protein